MTNTSNPPYRWPGHGTPPPYLSMWDQVKQFCKRLEISSQVRAMLSPGAGEKNFRRHEEITILVILHYLLKINITFMWWKLNQKNRGGSSGEVLTGCLWNPPTCEGSE